MGTRRLQSVTETPNHDDGQPPSREVFNFRVLPVLDKDSNRWLLIHWCGEGINWVKDVA
jgi:hypothetical protein